MASEVVQSPFPQRSDDLCAVRTTFRPVIAQSPCGFTHRLHTTEDFYENGAMLRLRGTAVPSCAPFEPPDDLVVDVIQQQLRQGLLPTIPSPGDRYQPHPPPRHPQR